MRRSGELVILANGKPLMSSRMHGSEEALATLACRRARTARRAIGAGRRARHGLHATRHARRAARGRDGHGRRAAPGGGRLESRRRSGRWPGDPLDDRRVTLAVGDVADTSARAPARIRRHPARRRQRTGRLHLAAQRRALQRPRPGAVRARAEARRRAGRVVGVGGSQVRAAAALRPVRRRRSNASAPG